MSVEIYPKLGLGYEVNNASAMFDLAKLPLGISVLQSISISLRNAALEEKGSSEFSKLQLLIDNALDGHNAGYLLEVSLFTDEFGNLIVPHGQLLLPIGIGSEPIDAYSEFLRTSQLRPSDNDLKTFKNSSFYIWIDKDPNNKMKAWTIPTQFRDKLIQSSVKEANRRNKLSTWVQSFPSEPYESIDRSNYWIEVERSKLKSIEDVNKRAEISKLTQEMKALETRVNKIYQNYQKLVKDSTNKNNLLKALSIANSIADIYNSAIKLDNLISSGTNKPVGGNQIMPPLTLAGTAEFIEKQKVTTDMYQEETTRALKIDFYSLEKIDTELGRKYQENKVSIPNRELNIPTLP